jgi:IS30 family transposase
MPPASAPKKASALERAIVAILATPEKSNRAIAAEIRVSHQTVKRARQRIKTAGNDVAVDVAVERVGRNGRRIKATGSDGAVDGAVERVGRNGRRIKATGSDGAVDGAVGL